jgi:hypothetical protein
MNLQRWLLLLFCLIFLAAQIVILNLGKGDIAVTGYLKGADFLYFHNGGALVRSGALYREGAFTGRLTNAYRPVGGQGDFRVLHPPLLFYLYAPISLIPFIPAISAATALFFLLWLLAAWLLWRNIPALRENEPWFFLMAIVFPPLSMGLQTGQPSSLWLLALAAGYLLHRSGKPFPAGMVLALLLAKPNYYLLTGAVILLAGEWKIAVGMFAGGAGLVLASGVWDGFGMWRGWLPVFVSYRDFLQSENRFARVYSARAFLMLMHPEADARSVWSLAGTVIGASMVALPALGRFFRPSARSLDRLWFCLPFALVLANPHIYDYDLVVLFVPFVIATERMTLAGVSWPRQLCVWVLVFGAVGLSAVLAGIARIQFAVPLFALALVWAAFRLPPDGGKVMERLRREKNYKASPKNPRCGNESEKSRESFLSRLWIFDRFTASSRRSR